jgi:hypothetical protein
MAFKCTSQYTDMRIQCYIFFMTVVIINRCYIDKPRQNACECDKKRSLIGLLSYVFSRRPTCFKSSHSNHDLHSLTFAAVFDTLAPAVALVAAAVVCATVPKANTHISFGAPSRFSCHFPTQQFQ